MKLSLITRVKRWLLRFTQLQLLLSAISLPILLGWGLPISVLSPLGNLLFTPLLTAFLTISTIIFFLELMYIPNGIFVFCLEKLTWLWLKMMSFGSSPGFLVGFRKPSLIFLLIMAGTALFIVMHKKTRSQGRSIILLALLLTLASVYLKFCTAPGTIIKQIPCNNAEVTLVHTHGITIVIDPGVIGKRISAPSWAEYTLVPAIVQEAGGNTIDHLIALQPGICAFNALERLCNGMKVKNLYLVGWEGTLSKAGWRSFFELKRTAELYGTTIIRIGSHEKKLTLTDNTIIKITPLDERISYQECTYPALSLSAQIDNQTFTIYSAKRGEMARQKEKPQNSRTKGLTQNEQSCARHCG